MLAAKRPTVQFFFALPDLTSITFALYILYLKFYQMPNSIFTQRLFEVNNAYFDEKKHDKSISAQVTSLMLLCSFMLCAKLNAIQLPHRRDLLKFFSRQHRHYS